MRLNAAMAFSLLLVLALLNATALVAESRDEAKGVGELEPAEAFTDERLDKNVDFTGRNQGGSIMLIQQDSRTGHLNGRYMTSVGDLKGEAAPLRHPSNEKAATDHKRQVSTGIVPENNTVLYSRS